MKYSKFFKFKVTGNVPVQKLPRQKIPKTRDPYMELIQKEKNVKSLRSYYGDEPHKLPLVSLEQEKIASLASRKEKLKMKSNIAKVRKAISSKYPGGIPSINDPKKLAQAKRLETKAFTSAQKSAIRFQQKLSEKAGIGIRRFGSKAVKKEYLPDVKARELGFPERESSIFSKYQYAKSASPELKIKKLEKLFYDPKYKKQQKVIKARIGSLKYEQKVSDVYSKTKGASYESPTFLSNVGKKARLERLFSGKSYIKRNK